MIQAIVFDFDGVIVDSEPLHFQAFLEVARPLGADFDYAHYVANYIGSDDRDGFRVMLGGQPGSDAGLPAGVVMDDLVQRKAEAFEAIVGRGVEPIPGVLKLIDDAARHVPLAIASGATRRDIDLILQVLGVADRFKTIVTADDVARSKPDPQTYAKAVTQLAAAADDQAITPAACLAIEDTPAGLASALGAGLMTLGVATSCGDTAREQLSKAARVVDHFEDLRFEQLQQWYG